MVRYSEKGGRRACALFTLALLEPVCFHHRDRKDFSRLSLWCPPQVLRKAGQRRSPCRWRLRTTFFCFSDPARCCSPGLPVPRCPRQRLLSPLRPPPAAPTPTMSGDQVNSLCDQLMKAVTVMMDPASTQRYRLEALKVLSGVGVLLLPPPSMQWREATLWAAHWNRVVRSPGPASNCAYCELPAPLPIPLFAKRSAPLAPNSSLALLQKAKVAAL